MIRSAESHNRRRPSVAAVAVRLFCLLCFSAASYAAFHMGEVPSKARLVHHTVADGETVWTISDQIARADNVNPEAVEETVCKVNGLNDGLVWPGMTILIPRNGGK